MSFKNLCVYTIYGETFEWVVVEHKIQYSLENFRSAPGRGHHALYTASDSRGKLLRLAEKLRKFCRIQYCNCCVVEYPIGLARSMAS